MILTFKTSDNKSKFEIDLDKEGISALIKQILDQAEIGTLSVLDTNYVKGLEKFAEEFKKIDLQVIGELIGLKIGESVHDKIIPAMKDMICKNRELLDKIQEQNKLLELYGYTYDQMRNLFNKI